VTHRSKRLGAFGELNCSLSKIKHDLEGLFAEARREALRWSEPTTRKFPLDRLRRRLAQVLCLDVLYAPKFMVSEFQRPGRPNPTKKWELSPVWRTAPSCAFRRAISVSSLLGLVVTHGWKSPNKLLHDLQRLSAHIWTMTAKSFAGLRRRIISVVLISDRKTRPTLGLLSLSVHPVIKTEYFLITVRRGSAMRNYGVKHLPRDSWTAVRLLNSRMRDKDL
jgi:hypothetical protein